MYKGKFIWKKERSYFLCRSGSLDGCICSGSQCRWAGFKRGHYYWRQPSPSWKSARSSRCWKIGSTCRKQLCSTSKCDWAAWGTCEQGRGFRKWNPICREKLQKHRRLRKKKLFRPNTGSTTFFNTGAHAPAGRSTDVAVQPKSFVDVSSHNETLVLATTVPLLIKAWRSRCQIDRRHLVQEPKCGEPNCNAQAAGLASIDLPLLTLYLWGSSACRSAFYIAEAQRLSPKNTLMVNDFEDAKMQPNITATPKLGRTKCVKNGYTNLMFYTSASWLDETTLRKKRSCQHRSIQA